MRQYLGIAASATVLALSLVAGAFAGSGNGGGTNGVMCVLNTQLAPPAGAASTASGHAQIKVWRDGTIQYRVFINNKAGETFTAGHIHAVATGGIVVPLFNGPSTTARHLRISSQVPSSPLASQLCTTPSAYYVNFHTTAVPAGAIRGDLG